VLGDLPSSLSLLARSRVIASGIDLPPRRNDALESSSDVPVHRKSEKPSHKRLGSLSERS